MTNNVYLLEKKIKYDIIYVIKHLGADKMGLFDILFGWIKGRKKDLANDDVVSTASNEPIGSTKTEEPKGEEPAPTPKKKRAPRQKQTEPVEQKPDQITADTVIDEPTQSEQVQAKPEKVGRFEIKKARDGRFVFNLYASNHVIIATSQVYSSVQSALNGIKSVMANAERAPIEDQTAKGYVTLPYPKWELYQDNGGQYRFRLSASNGSCICHSQGYTSKANAKGGIVSIQRFAATAEIDKAYLDK